MPAAVEVALVATGYFTAGSIATTIVAYAIVIAATYAYGSYASSQAKRAARDAANNSAADRLVMTATTDAARSRLYGLVRNTDGVLFKATHGAKSEFYTFVVAVAGHEIDSFVQIWFNDIPLTLDGSGNVLTAPFAVALSLSAQVIQTPDGSGAGTVFLPADYVAGSASVTQSDGVTGDGGGNALLPPFSISGLTLTYTGAILPGVPAVITYQRLSGTPKARVRTYTGAPTQDISADLIALGIPGVDATFKFSGIALMLVTLTYDQEAFAQGVPSMTAVVRGAKCFDPRNGNTSWTRNPALIARDWATYSQGGGALAAEIADDILIASANACDVAATFAIDGAASITGPTFACDIVCPTQADPTQSLQEIVAAMAGKYAWAGGRLRIKAAYFSGAVGGTLDETWLSGLGSINITAGASRLDLFNVIRATIANAANGYVVAPIDEVTADVYVTADGQKLQRDLTFLGISDSYRAQHVAAVMIRESRQALTVQIPCNMLAYPLEIFDVVNVTLPRFGWSNKAFEVALWEFGGPSGVVLTLREIAAEAYDLDDSFSDEDAAPNTNLPSPWVVTRPTGVAVTSGVTALDDGSIVTRTRVEWDAADSASVAQAGKFEVQAFPLTGVTPDADWPAYFTEGGATETTIVGLLSQIPYVFKVRQINSIGIRSDWSRQVVHVIAAPPKVNGTTQSETAPVDPVDGDLWQKPSTGIIYRWNASISSWVQFGTIGADWSQITGIPYASILNNDDSGALGFSLEDWPASAPKPNGWAIWAGGNPIRELSIVRAGISAVRYSGTSTSTNLGLWRQADFHTTPLPAGTFLQGSVDIYVVSISVGVPGFLIRCYTNAALTTFIDMQMGAAASPGGWQRIPWSVHLGPTDRIYGIAAFLFGSRVGSPVAFSGDVVFDNLIFALYDATTANSAITLNPDGSIAGGPSGQVTITGLGYTGALDATTDISLVATGGCILAGNTGSKAAGGLGWNAQVYGRDSYHGGMYVTAIAGQNNADIMFGLNSDPTADANYTSLDYAIYLNATGSLDVFESGAGITIARPYVAGDVLAVQYLGGRVDYLQNGIVFRSVPAAGGLTLFVDSSFYTPGAILRNIRCGPMSGTDWANINGVQVSTGQLANNAATDVYVTAVGSAVSITGVKTTPDGFAGLKNTQVRTLAFTAAVTGNAYAIFDGLGTYSNSSGSPGQAAWSIQDDAGTFDGWKTLSATVPGSASGFVLSMSTTRAFSVTAGTTYNLSVYANKFRSGDTFDVSNCELRVEVIKR